MVKRDLEFGLTGKESSSHREALNKHTMGRKKYLSMVDKGTKQDNSKNLPFTFSKPSKSSKCDVECYCTFCETYTRVNKNTIMVICRSCKKLYNVLDTAKRV